MRHRHMRGELRADRRARARTMVLTVLAAWTCVAAAPTSAPAPSSVQPGSAASDTPTARLADAASDTPAAPEVPAAQLASAAPNAPAAPVAPAADASGAAGASPASDAPALEPIQSVRPDTWPGYHGGVVGGPHDFSEVTGRIGDACSACHVPHVQAIRPVTATQPSTQPAVEMFRIGGQRAVFVPGRYTPGPTSLICLGCHDGTVATSTIGSAHAMLSAVREGFVMPDGFTWRDHPIGVPYPSDRREYRPQAFVEKTLRLPEGRMECVTCHDPHNEKGLPAMLSVSNRRSNLCVTCHIK